MGTKRKRQYPFISADDIAHIHTGGINFTKLKNNIYSPYFWFLHLNKTIPSMSVFYEVHYSRLLRSLLDHYNLLPGNLVKNETFIDGKNQTEMRAWTLFIRRNFLLFYDSSDNSLQLLHDNEEPASYVDEWIRFIGSFTEKSNRAGRAETKIKILNQYGPELSFTNFKVPKPDLDINLHYNDDFRAVHETIVKRLQTPNDSGLVLLHGVPGTGKTTYIRYLSFILDKPMVFIPQEISHDLSSVNFVTFMLDHPNSILIIEDAENIIVDKGSRNFSVSSLLNVADGLLSDCLNLQVICTFNTDIRSIDKALLRKGRLIALYEFRKLTVSKSGLLASRLGIEKKIDEPLTLADIYHMQDPGFTYSDKQKIGFKK